MQFLFTLAAFAVALGLLIVVHEFGHYLVARWCGVKVLRFSVGFGKPLFARRLGHDQTEWVVAAFPLGGYVKMLDENEGAVAPEERNRAFNRQPVLRRFGIVAAGPLANFLLAIVLYWILFVHGVQGLKPVLGPVTPASPAAFAAFQPGETIIKINGESAATWQDVRWMLLQLAVQKAMVNIEVRNERGEIAWRKLDLSMVSAEDLDSEFLKKIGLTNYQPTLRPVIGRLVANGAAQRAGLREGDEILAINGSPIARWEEVVQWIRRSASQNLQIEVLREGAAYTMKVVPDPVLENGVNVGKIGVAPRMDQAELQKFVTEVRYSPWAALEKALEKTWDTSLFSLKILGKMVVGEVSWKNVSGPITIADYAGQTAQMGWVSYFGFLALISISLGVLNLLPIPLLDGGHLMYYTIEVIRGTPLSDRAMEIGQHVGMVLLFGLMVFAIYNDINRLISG